MSTGVYLIVMLVASALLSVGGPLAFWLFRKPGWRSPDAEALLEGEPA